MTSSLTSDVKWTDYFYYDESSPSCLRWKINKFAGNGGNVLKVRAGSVAGCKKHRGYFQVKLDQVCYLVHRIVWELHYGKVPEDADLDHVDGNPSNNVISNLRTVPHSINSRNRKKYGTNTSGVTGVQLTDNRKGSYYWTANWYDLDGVRHRVPFSVHKYGYDEAFKLACEYRAAKLAELNNIGAGYTDRHGS